MIQIHEKSPLSFLNNPPRPEFSVLLVIYNLNITWANCRPISKLLPAVHIKNLTKMVIVTLWIISLLLKVFCVCQCTSVGIYLIFYGRFIVYLVVKKTLAYCYFNIKQSRAEMSKHTTNSFATLKIRRSQKCLKFLYHLQNFT